MSNTGNGLERVVSVYTGDVIDISLVRQALRNHRKRHFGSNRKAAVAAGIDPSTVAKIENLKSWPNYDPGIGIVLKLLTAMKIPLREFVDELHDVDQAFDRVAAGELPSSALATSLPSGSAPTPRPDDEALPTLTREEHATIRALTQVVKQLSNQRAESDRGAHHRHAATTRVEEPTPHRGLGDHRQGPVKRRLKRRRPPKR